MSSSSSSEPPPPLAPGSSSPPSATATTTSATVNRKGQPKKFHRILWDSDAATRGGKTSIGVLLAWLAAPGNYERWRDGKSQFGETREALCSQIKAEMARHGILHRENANIRTQLSELERSFDNAMAWLAQSGFSGRLPAATTAGAQEVESHVLRLCRYFHTLEPVMGVAARSLAVASARGRVRRSLGERPGKPSAAVASEDADEHRSAVEAEPSSSASLGGAAAMTSKDDPAPEHSVLRPEPAAETPVVAASADRAAERQPPAPQKRRSPSPPTSSGALTDGTASSDTSSVAVAPVQIPVMSSPESPSAPIGVTLPPETAASLATAGGGARERAAPAAPPASTSSEQWQAAASDPEPHERSSGSALEAAREEREHKRFRMDEERNRLECEKLRYEVQAAKLKLQVERALARKRLEKADLSPAEVAAAVEL